MVFGRVRGGVGARWRIDPIQRSAKALATGCGGRKLGRERQYKVKRIRRRPVRRSRVRVYWGEMSGRPAITTLG